MSFLSILLVASAFYFAHARPDTHSTAYSNNTYPEKVPEGSSVPMTHPTAHQHQLYSFMQELSKAVDQYMTPLMSKLEDSQKDELKNMCLNGFISYINYCLIIMEEKEMEKEHPAHSETPDDSLPRNEMIVQFESFYSLLPSSSYIADTPLRDDKDGHEE